MRKLLLPIVWVAVVLAIPIIPLLWFGESIQKRTEGWLDAALPPSAVAALAVGMLATSCSCRSHWPQPLHSRCWQRQWHADCGRQTMLIAESRTPPGVFHDLPL